jgi:RimJ/RimL family protein N-acetyltransferase
MEFTICLLTEEYAREVCSWKYEGQYEVYNIVSWGTALRERWNITLKDKRESEYVAVMAGNELAAFGRIAPRGGMVYIGIGLKPSWCGRGFGADIMNLLVYEARGRYPGRAVALEVRTFNKRAVKCYMKAGFVIKYKHLIKTSKGLDEYYHMDYANTKNILQK